MKDIFLSATSLATITVAPVARPSNCGAEVLFAPVGRDDPKLPGFRYNRAVAVVSVATVLAATTAPATGAVIYSVNGATTTGTITVTKGVATTTGMNPSTLNTTPLGLTNILVGQSKATTFIIGNRLDAAGINGANSNIALTFSSASSTLTTGQNTTLTGGGTSSTVTASVSANVTIRGQSVAGSFTISGTSVGVASGPGAAATPDVTDVSISVLGVAPQASTTGSAVYLLANSGASASSSFTITNVGDGNLAGADNGSTLLSNLRGTNTVALGSNWSGTVTSPVNLTDGISQSSGFTYKAQTTRQTNISTVTTSLTTGSTDGRNLAQTLTTTLTGQTVAPVASVTPSIDFGTLRTGTSATATMTVTNVGDGNLAGKTSEYNLRGNVGSLSGPVTGGGGSLNGTTGLNDSNYGVGATTSASFTFTYTAGSRGVHDTSIATTLDNGTANSNSSGTATTTVKAAAVGPVYESKFTTNGATTTTTLAASGPGTGAAPNVEVYGGTILFGDQVGGLTLQNLLISNISTDNAAAKLTDLSLTSVTITGSNEYSFSLSGFTGSTATAYPTVHNQNNSPNTGNIAIQFNNLAGTGTGQLRVATDENAALGQAGTVYVYDLRWTVPEPGTIMVFGAGLLGLAISRRTRRGRVEAVRLTAGADDTR